MPVTELIGHRQVNLEGTDVMTLGTLLQRSGLEEQQESSPACPQRGGAYWKRLKGQTMLNQLGHG